MNYKILVNKNNLIPNNYNINDFVKVKLVDDTLTLIEKETFNHYKQLKKKLEDYNIIIGLDSVYRSIDEQKEILENFTKKYGEEYANSIVAKPGTSEHHTGLAIDLSIKINDNFIIEGQDLLKYEKEFAIIHSFLSNYGFILRYPKNKEKITGYPYEPWHIRYVGNIAKYICEKNITLEEYEELNEKSSNRNNAKHIKKILKSRFT